MQITFLGTGNAFAPQRDWGCVLVNGSILLDAGPSVLVNLKRLSIDCADIRYLLLSHFHADHYFGLPFLLLEYAFRTATTTPLTIIGPPGVEQRVATLLTTAYPELAGHPWPRPMRFVEARDGVTEQFEDFSVQPVLLEHGPAEIDAFGYRLALPEGLLAYTGDASMTPAIQTLVDGARVLILEATSDHDSPVHLGRKDIETILTDTSSKCVTFLTHLDTPSDTPWLDLAVMIPRDLQSFHVTFTENGMPVVQADETDTSRCALHTSFLQQLRQRERELAAVIHVTNALQSQIGLNELMRQAVLAAISTVDADTGSLLLHDPDRHKLVFRHAEGPTRDRVMGLEFDDTRGIAGEVFHSGKARISHNVEGERTHITDIDRATAYQTHNMMTVPLRASKGETIGLLQILNKRTGLFDNSDLEVVEVLATQVASAIMTAQLYERAQAAIIVDLLGQISHDIKNLLTPVTMAEYTLRVLLTDFFNMITSSQQQADEMVPALKAKVHEISEDVETIFSIFEESAEIAQQRTKELSDTIKGLTSPAVFETAIIDGMVQVVCRMLQLVAEKRGVELRVLLEETPEVPYDSKRMYNALYNLINNALDSTSDGGSVTITTVANAAGKFPEGKYLEITVADTGCGMPAEIAAQLFTGHVRSTKPGGSGLGARVVKNVIDAHGGRLYVNSSVGLGTTIRARIPLYEADR